MTQPGTFDHHHPERLANVLTVPPTGLFACATLTLTVKTQNRISICVQRQVAEQDAVCARIRQRMVDLLGDDGVLAVPSAASVALPQVGFLYQTSPGRGVLLSSRIYRFESVFLS